MKLLDIIVLTVVISSLVSLLTYTEVIKFEKVLKIKWELIINLLLGISTIITWSLIEKNDYRTWIIALIPTILFIYTLVNYSKIKEVREFLLRTW